MLSCALACLPPLRFHKAGDPSWHTSLPCSNDYLAVQRNEHTCLTPHHIPCHVTNIHDNFIPQFAHFLVSVCCTWLTQPVFGKLMKPFCTMFTQVFFVKFCPRLCVDTRTKGIPNIMILQLWACIETLASFPCNLPYSSPEHEHWKLCRWGVCVPWWGSLHANEATYIAKW